MNRHSQKGSALLIVLGFLSFMVVSAVAFAIWMRTERLPSSALRRTVANRYLVKAALAQAMSRVDDAIRSHVFPGAWPTNDTKNGTYNVDQDTERNRKIYRDKNNCAYDWWESRVFMPPDPEGGTSSSDPNSRYAPITKTVSVLNLEALGYLPPSIVNDVRFLSRSSWAAQWDYFNFDAGRYAFCAVNVSDMLDITKIAANSARTSGAAAHAKAPGELPPASRFSLAYLFRTKNDDFGYVNSDILDKFDQLVHTQHDLDSVPLVSIMDYNLSVGENTMGNFYSPFVEWVTGINNTRQFYRGSSGANNSYVKGAERQPFVTCSWFPQSDSAGATLSMTPPFRNGTLESSTPNNLDFALNAQEKEFWQTMANNGHAFCMMDQFSLFDYLDLDSLPVSLAMPCVEGVPMFAALCPLNNIKVEFVPPDPTKEPEKKDDGSIRRKYYDTKIKVTATGLGLGASIFYPFEIKPPTECKVQAFGRLVFVAEPKGGGAATTVSLRNSKFARNFRPLNEDEWMAQVDEDKQFMLEKGSSQGSLTHDSIENCMLVTLPSRENLVCDLKQQNPETCCQDKPIYFKDVVPKEGKTILRKVETYEISKNSDGTDAEKLKETKYQIVLRPFDVNGDVISANDITDKEISEGELDMICDKYTIRPYLVTWARITSKEIMPEDSGKYFTVDMVPATYEDDKAFNNVDNTQFDIANFNQVLGNSRIKNDPQNPSEQRAMPIMRFPSDMTFSYSDARDAAKNGALKQVPGGDWSDKACYAVDPRFNWAPENWWFDSSSAPKIGEAGKKWYEAVFLNGGTSGKGILDDLVQAEYGNGYGRGDRANDPSLFVSSLGYLQSVGELAFLPHLSDMHESNMPDCILGDKKEDIDNGSHTGRLYDGVPREIGSAIVNPWPCALAAWKSYQNYRTNPEFEKSFEFGANLYRRGLVNDPQGFYINPYTQSQEIMLAALANTPLNYGAAGVGKQGTQSKTGQIPFKDGEGAMFDSRRISGEDLNKIATFMRHRFEDLAAMIEVPAGMDMYAYNSAWEDMFDALDWSGTMECKVKDVYESLSQYYNAGGGNAKNYSKRYVEENGYPTLNQFAMGDGSKKINAGFKLYPERAVHWNEEKDLMADPLRGQCAGDTADTTCYTKLRDVDRMFLHSYWRDCFANRQQLFLIFVRAESTALGGAGEGTPAQQGGRAVALVWRDPVAPGGGDVYEEDSNQYQPSRHPHKMRVLFYRQFD